MARSTVKWMYPSSIFVFTPSEAGRTRAVMGANRALPARLWAFTGLVVLLSVLLHGLTAKPVMERLDRWRRLTWFRRARAQGGPVNPADAPPLPTEPARD